MTPHKKRLPTGAIFFYASIAHWVWPCYSSPPALLNPVRRPAKTGPSGSFFKLLLTIRSYRPLNFFSYPHSNNKIRFVNDISICYENVSTIRMRSAVPFVPVRAWSLYRKCLSPYTPASRLGAWSLGPGLSWPFSLDAGTL